MKSLLPALAGAVSQLSDGGGGRYGVQAPSLMGTDWVRAFRYLGKVPIQGYVHTSDYHWRGRQGESLALFGAADR